MKLYAVDLQERKEAKSQAIVLPENPHTLGTWYMKELSIYALHSVPFLAKQRPHGTAAEGLQGPSPASPHEIQLKNSDGLHSKFNLHLLQPPPGTRKACIFIVGKD